MPVQPLSRAARLFTLTPPSHFSNRGKDIYPLGVTFDAAGNVFFTVGDQHYFGYRDVSK